ncbi:MAG: fumarylacetoacetate hydrolase family protein [Burkholderiales bacterium]|nr:fumarylacetoacetate hydrolase family protein [Burkholderiales bacterium]
MKLVTYSAGKRAPAKIGVVAPDGSIIDLEAAAKKTRVKLPFAANDMIGLVAAGKAGLALVKKAVAGLKTGHHRFAKVTLHAPIPRPRKNVFCVGWNYVEHFEEGAKARPHVQELPKHPAFFSKQPLAVNGPFGDVPSHPGVTQKLDWEVEMAVVIGKGGRNIKEADAMKHIYGYMIANDVSAREVQRQHGQQWFKGKSLDGHCPRGPWLTTADEVKNPQGLRITSRVNGVTKQDSNTSYMYFKLPRLIAELSAGLTLEPGDLFLTGTPAGVGHARNPPEFMKPGDILETEVEGLGLLRNKIAAK